MPLQWQLGSVCDVKVVGDASSSLITRILRGSGAILHDLRTQLTPLVPEECRREKTYFFFVLSFLSFLYTISVALYHFASSRISVVFRSQVVFWLLTDRTRWQTSISDIKTKTPGSQWLRWWWWLWWWWWATLRFLWWLGDKGDLRNCLWLICQSKPTDGRFTPLCPTQSIEGPQYRRDRDLWLRDLLAGDRDSQRLGGWVFTSAVYVQRSLTREIINSENLGHPPPSVHGVGISVYIAYIGMDSWQIIGDERLHVYINFEC